MLVNFSNHRIENWSAEQLATAKTYGEIVDVPFPNVDPTGSVSYIADLADECVEKLMSIIENPECDVVHIMGELNLVYCVVNKLKSRGVKCVVSTTERNVEEKVLDNGEIQKIATFKFCTFREF